ncbi:hypothetical protein LPB41_14275 [Thalassospira sp. MA62]|nr:hypothetical protein [Thalassospira sp. MA62]
MSDLVPFKSGSAFYVKPGAQGNGIRCGYILPEGLSFPDKLPLNDAIGAWPGWFVFTPAMTDDDVEAFIPRAQAYFANSARAGSLMAWFPAANDVDKTLAGSVVYADRDKTSQTAVVSRLAEIAFGNMSIDLPPGTTVAMDTSSDGLFLSGGKFSTTPFGARKPVSLKLDQIGLPILFEDQPNGLFRFDLSIDNLAADSLDIGLRSFSAPSAGGYAQTARYRVFDLRSDTAKLELDAFVDPNDPLNVQRTVFSLAKHSDTISTFYQSSSGKAISVTPGASAGLIFSERLTAADKDGNPVVLPNNQILYLAPAGEFTFNLNPGASKTDATGQLEPTLMGGLSAVEYFEDTGNPVLEFVPNQNAFARTLKDKDEKSARVFGSLSDTAKSSWAMIKNATSTQYFAQPDSSVLHQSQADGAADPSEREKFLVYLPLSLGHLAGQTTLRTQNGNLASEEISFPITPYVSVEKTGLEDDDLAGFEDQVLSPTRRRIVQKIVGLSAPHFEGNISSVGLPKPPYSTTPQGLMLHLGENLAWSDVTIGHSPSLDIPSYRQNRLLLENVSGELKDALQSNQLFLVITSADLFAQYASIPYSLTTLRKKELTVQIDNAQVNAKIAAIPDQQWPDYTSFKAAIEKQLTPEEFKQYFPTVRNTLGDFSLFVADWEFDLSPWRWSDHNTILIFKFCDKKLSQLVEDTNQWAAPDAFMGSPKGTRQRLENLLNDAEMRFKAGEDDFDYFVNTVMNTDTWNGVLALNAKVPLSGLPAQMEGLAAGIDPSKFQAHHMGITVTPVKSGTTTYETTPSTAFGLIDYESIEPLSGGDNYDFKVNSLKVRIASSEIASFSSKIELLVNELFNEKSSQNNAPDNNLILHGVYQKSGNSGTYVFNTTAATSYGMTSAVLDVVGIRSASFVTVSAGNDTNTTVQSKFVLTGAVDFIHQPLFDLFSYGNEESNDPTIDVQGLSYANLSIDMVFDAATPSYRTFAFDAQHITLDGSGSSVRPESLCAHFPMKLTGLTQGLEAVTPDTLGFMPVDSPIEGTVVKSPWFGLNFELDLGSAGALASKVGFNAELLLAWAPAPVGSSPRIYIGLKLPGVKGGERSIPIEGVLKIAFSDVTFLVHPPTYILKLGDIALKLLALSFPPNGQIDLLMFGNPDAQTSGALGWYASYVKNGAGDGKTTSRRLTMNDSQDLLASLQDLVRVREGQN